MRRHIVDDTELFTTPLTHDEHMKRLSHVDHRTVYKNESKVKFSAAGSSMAKLGYKFSDHYYILRLLLNGVSGFQVRSLFANFCLSSPVSEDHSFIHVQVYAFGIQNHDNHKTSLVNGDGAQFLKSKESKDAKKPATHPGLSTTQKNGKDMKMDDEPASPVVHSIPKPSVRCFPTVC